MCYSIRSAKALLPLIAPAIVVLMAVAAPAQSPIRGDSNGDQKIDISDPIHILNFLFAGGKAPPCTPVADANGDGKLDISDAVATLTHLFGGQSELPPFSSAELNECARVLRRGRLIDVLDPGHQIDGRVEELSTLLFALTTCKDISSPSTVIDGGLDVSRS